MLRGLLYYYCIPQQLIAHAFSRYQFCHGHNRQGLQSFSLDPLKSIRTENRIFSSLREDTKTDFETYPGLILG